MLESWSNTYTDSDIETVMRRFAADIQMIAQSSGAISADKIREYVHDVEVFAKEGHLKDVDVTLLDGGSEIRAARFEVHDSAANLAMLRPGGFLWPLMNNPDLRIVIHTKNYDAIAKVKIKHKLKLDWTDTNVDTRHLSLMSKEARSYESNGWSMMRRDYF